MLWEVVNTESAIKAEAAQSQKDSGLHMNPCVSWSKNAVSDSVVGFESLELLRNRCDQSLRFLFAEVEVCGCFLDQSFKRSSFAVISHTTCLASSPDRCTTRVHKITPSVIGESLIIASTLGLNRLVAEVEVITQDHQEGDL